MLLVVVLVLAGAMVIAAAAALTVRARRATRPATSPVEADVPRDEPEPAGPRYGLMSPPGPDYAPQPVLAEAPSVPRVSVSPIIRQPHRPAMRNSARPASSRRGAHRRGADAKEIARLHALHESGALSAEELTSLKARLA